MAAAAIATDVTFRVTKTDDAARDSTFINLLHDLRQPLSSIEAIAYYLEMTIPAQHAEARAMLFKLQQIVEDAGSILDRAERRQ
jgi:K+-sensing histidine kinase KdpD